MEISRFWSVHELRNTVKILEQDLIKSIKEPYKSFLVSKIKVKLANILPCVLPTGLRETKESLSEKHHLNSVCAQLGAGYSQILCF